MVTVLSSSNICVTSNYDKYIFEALFNFCPIQNARFDEDNMIPLPFIITFRIRQ